ncbi:hypothetical protein Fcan01_24097 [Folsomia candida]|uniref:Uncharacterized protein n=1 Tax=Folsomia candida TaxID=158441 RepID=A0A226D8F7_FOLCA|nr:hypothetical protein Fcan01_24097 [Folsomia candida]
MSSKKSYKNYFRSPTEGNSQDIIIPQRTTHRLQQISVRNVNHPDINLDNADPPSACPKNLSHSFTELSQLQNFEVNDGSNDGSMDRDDQSDLSSDISSDESDAEGNNDTEQPIYQGARITPMESCLLIYSFAIRHKIDKSTMSDLLTLINFHLPNGALIPSSVFLLNKSLGPDYNSAKKIPYCSQCQLIIDEVEGKCLKCEEKVSSSGAIKCGSYFISFDIGSIMKSLLQQQLILDSLDKTFKSRDSAADTLRDIKDGLAYKNLRLQKYDLSCCVNTDGVAIFNSSRFSIWPLLLSINELDYRLRRKHTILAGLWFGVEKPNFNLFLQPLTEQANILGREGIKWTRNGINVTSRILFPMFAADSVARCQIQGITQFNGEFSCPWCLMKGENYKISERSHKWIFDPKESAPLRNHESFLEHLKQLRDILFHGSSATNNFGIKTASCLLKLPSFNIIDGFVFDYMHTVLLGVVRMLTFAWTDSKNHNKPFYIGSKADIWSCAQSDKILCQMLYATLLWNIIHNLPDHFHTGHLPNQGAVYPQADIFSSTLIGDYTKNSSLHPLSNWTPIVERDGCSNH